MRSTRFTRFIAAGGATSRRRRRWSLLGLGIAILLVLSACQTVGVKVQLGDDVTLRACGVTNVASDGKVDVTGNPFFPLVDGSTRLPAIYERDGVETSGMLELEFDNLRPDPDSPFFYLGELTVRHPGLDEDLVLDRHLVMPTFLVTGLGGGVFGFSGDNGTQQVKWSVFDGVVTLPQDWPPGFPGEPGDLACLDIIDILELSEGAAASDG